MDWCVQFSGFLGMSAHNPYICRHAALSRLAPGFFGAQRTNEPGKKRYSANLSLICQCCIVLTHVRC